MVSMGACMSTSGEESEQRKRSQKIDKDLEEDSKRLRRECKILLLGMSILVTLTPEWKCANSSSRLRRERKVDDCQADEDYPSARIFRGGAQELPADGFQESH